MKKKKLTHTNDIYKFHTNKLPVIFDHILIWPHLGKLIFLEHLLFKNTFNGCVCNSKQSDRILYKAMQYMKIVSENFTISTWILDISISFNAIYFCLFHIHFSMVFDHWFSWQLWHHKWKKCVTRTESLRGVGLKWLYLN